MDSKALIGYPPTISQSIFRVNVRARVRVRVNKRVRVRFRKRVRVKKRISVRVILKKKMLVLRG